MDPVVNWSSNEFPFLITARKRNFGQGNIFTPVCHSVHRGGVRGCRGGVHGCRGGMHGCRRGHAWLQGGHAWLYRGGMHGCSRGACVVAQGGVRGCSGGHAWLLRGGMHGCSRGGACVVALGEHAWLLGGHAWLLGGLRGWSWGGAWFFWGGEGVRGFFYEIRSMSGRYASYWNAFLFREYFF